MASIRRTDIMHKKYSKGRPAKSDREKTNRRQESYKWRDARRVYLASSFDRWRKLRSTLKLKDSSLAWHLMEAHEKGQCTVCRHSESRCAKDKKEQRGKGDQREFLPSLIASIRQLCHAHFDFDECIEIVGLLCLEFDKKRKENFSLNELIKSGLKPALPSYVSKSLHEQPDYSAHETNSSLPLPNTCLRESDERERAKVMTTHDYEEPSFTSAYTPCSTSQGAKLVTVTEPSFNRPDQRVGTNVEDAEDPKVVSSSNSDGQHFNATADPDPLSSSFLKSINHVDSHTSQVEGMQLSDLKIKSTAATIRSSTWESGKDFISSNKTLDSSTCSESEIDIEKLNSSHEDNNSFHHNDENQPSSGQASKSDIGSRDVLEALSDPVSVNSLSESQPTEKDSPKCNKDGEMMLMQPKAEVESEEDTPGDHTVKSHSAELPLDMTMLKQESRSSQLSHSTIDCSRDMSPLPKGHDGNHLESSRFSPSAGKRKMTEASSSSSSGSRRSPFWAESFQSRLGKHREEGHASIPWQRRDMSRKEEYEFLELNPFSDLADFSQRYPHVHQRTYYRWKRRIKEEYIILEQCPDMSFQEFSSIVLQAKESVFRHWKSLIAQGKGFFAPSDTSKRLEAKWSLKSGTPQNTEYTFMQKHLSVTYDQFCLQFPGTSLDAFNVLKRKAMQDFWLFHQNQHMSHKDFSKLVNVSEDVFKTWKEYVECLRSNSVSPNLKSIPGSVSPNPAVSLPGFQPLDSPKSSSSDLTSHSPKDSLFNIMNCSAAFKESLAAVHAGALNPALNDSVARSMSTSYLASLQNMMFPWHSYYGMTSPLGQQMLPMMLWPGMMGLAGGMANPLGLISGSPAVSASRSSAASGLQSSFLATSTDSNESPKVSESRSKYQGNSAQGTSQVAEGESLEGPADEVSADGEKKLKLSHEKEDLDFWGSVSRSRKQNKQEYVYYLKNPELGFKELESLFPSISLRTFYRWRKEMNAAVLLIEENKDMTFHQFKMVFPDIPEEIFESWKERAERGVSPSLQHDSQLLMSTESNCSTNSSSHEEQKPLEQPEPMDISATELDDGTCDQNSVLSSQTGGGEDATLHRKCSKEEYLFVQKNPGIDFASFTRLYPSASVRSFYRWKKELKDAVDYLRANPIIDFDAYKAMDATASEEVFNVWKMLAQSESIFEEDASDGTASLDEKEARVPAHLNRKVNGPEYYFLQLNPYIEFSQFTRTYPEVPKRTFYRWKQEIHQIMNYIRAQPTVEFSDIVSILPEISQDAFLTWKQIIRAECMDYSESKDSTDDSSQVDYKAATLKYEVDEQAKTQMTEALLYLMHHPTIKYKHFKTQFAFVSEATFQIWLNRIKNVILYVASNPGMDYATFSMGTKDVAEDIFEVWKSLGPDDIAAMDLGCTENMKADEEEPRMSFEGHMTWKSDDTGVSQKAVEFCQKNPLVSFSTFQIEYPSISEQVFHDWISKINEQLQYIRNNPGTEFQDFSKIYPFTKPEIFHHWKSDCISLRDSHPQNFLLDPGTEHAQEDRTSRSAEEDTKFLANGKSRSPERAMSGLMHLREKGLSAKPVPRDYAQESEGTPLQTDESFGRVNSPTDDPNESSLSKLARFADSGAVAHSAQYHDDKKSLSRSMAEFYTERQKLESPVEHLYRNNNNKSLHVEPSSSPSNMDNFLSVTNNSAAAHHRRLDQGQAPSMGSIDEYNANLVPSPVHTSSLSALMAMSRNKEGMNKGDQSASTRKDRPGGGNSNSISPVPVGNLHWQGASSVQSAVGSGGALKEDDEAFSSQRQKKISRAEYMFVKDNPDVDSQEFSRIFPGVSARTFYRWKKEIKAQLQLA